ncbi:glycosyltransferase family 2 protein [Confluentibacter flavum]|uniref:Glycosyl transferase family 2 n=1 Tax=Confluentibacter flavum TaxID=1909700 RepID=A0A2N3HP90_9FLAO|nr:glycosyltransferase [Confluentibacter flavum]PKQ46742.1 glycosyl transferase family 2 [Confluentibacter flavum]
MLFKFLKYLQPTHYFSLLKVNGDSIFPVIDELPKAVLEQLVKDDHYTCEIAKHYDLSWQAIHKGYIGNAKTYSNIEDLPLVDNYRFARKYFHPGWVFYVLIIRLLSLNSPFKEFYAWFKTRSAKRIKYLSNPLKYDQWSNFTSQLIKQNPFVSVVIPTLNRYSFLKDVLKDLEQQDYKHFEVIIIDQSEPFQENFYKSFDLNIRIIYQKEKALWLARNTAIKSANSELIAFSEDDVRIQPDWISSHLMCLDFFNTQISAGVFFPEGKPIPKERSYFTLASQFATGNAMVYKAIFHTVGLFDRQFEKQRMGDGEFGLRVYLQGLKSISNPYASCIDVKASEGGLRQMGSWDAFRTSNLFAPRPIPSVLYFFRRYFGDAQARLALLRTVPLSIMPYRFKANKALQLLGVFVSIIILPLVLFQVIKSWRLSSIKLKQGPFIEPLS